MKNEVLCQQPRHYLGEAEYLRCHCMRYNEIQRNVHNSFRVIMGF